MSVYTLTVTLTPEEENALHARARTLPDWDAGPDGVGLTGLIVRARKRQKTA